MRDRETNRPVFTTHHSNVTKQYLSIDVTKEIEILT